MAKLTLTDIAAGYALITTLNANNTLIEAALENTLSRDGTTPNTLSADLDMNSNKITNLTDGTGNQDAVTLSQVTAQIAAAASTITAAAANLVSVADAGGYFIGSTVEAILQELGADSVTGTYTATLSTGWSTTPTGTIGYHVSGGICTLYVDAAIQATSDAATFQVSGAPAAIRPNTQVAIGACQVTDNSNSVIAGGTMSSAGLLNFLNTADGLGANFTTSGTKGLPTGFIVQYRIQP